MPGTRIKVLHAIPPSNREPGRVIPGNHMPMKFYEGDHVIDHKGREVRLEERARMGRFLVWLASPIIEGKADTDHCVILKHEEIKAAKQPAGFQFLLA